MMSKKIPDFMLNMKGFETSKEGQKFLLEGLAKRIDENPLEAKKEFTERQIEDIQKGETPEGFVWVANQENQSVRLVDSKKQE